MVSPGHKLTAWLIVACLFPFALLCNRGVLERYRDWKRSGVAVEACVVSRHSARPGASSGQHEASANLSVQPLKARGASARPTAAGCIRAMLLLADR